MGLSQHRDAAPPASAIRVAIVTASDTRTRETDEGGAVVQTLMAQAGFVIFGREVVADDHDQLRAWIGQLISTSPTTSHGAVGPDVIVVTGGTGVAPRDVTVDAIAPLFERRLDGFGELFRMLSFAEIGAAAMLSRACAGIVASVPIFLIPGSPAAIRLALERLILPELRHLISELRRRRAEAVTPGRHGQTHQHEPDHHH